MAKIPYYEYFKRNEVNWVNLSVANGSLYYTDPMRVSVWGERIGIIVSSTATCGVTMQYSHDGVQFFDIGANTPSDYSTLVTSFTGVRWCDLKLGATGWLRLAVQGVVASSASTFVFNHVEEH